MNNCHHVTNSVGITLIQILSPENKELNATPAGSAPIPRFHFIGAHPVTQQTFETVTGERPSAFRHSMNPVESVSWYDAVGFCNRLSELPAEKTTGRVYRLPTETEWEFACRANTKTAFSFGSCEDRLRDFAWFGDNSGVRGDVLPESRRDITERVAARIIQRCRPHPVGQKRPNPWGLYDMHGNVWEWCCNSADIGGSNVDGRGINAPTGQRFLRGGSWLDSAWECRSASRTSSDPDDRNFCNGFRVVMTIRDS